MATTDAILDALTARLPLVLPTVAVLVAMLLLQNVLRPQPLANIPVAGRDLGGDEKRRQAYLFKAADLYHEGYNKVGHVITPPALRSSDAAPPLLVQRQRLQDRDSKQ